MTAYLACARCGWSYPIDTTAHDEACGQCGGTLMAATNPDGPPRPLNPTPPTHA